VNSVLNRRFGLEIEHSKTTGNMLPVVNTKVVPEWNLVNFSARIRRSVKERNPAVFFEVYVYEGFTAW